VPPELPGTPQACQKSIITGFAAPSGPVRPHAPAPLATSARPPAIPALIAASVARHDRAALGAERGVGRHGRKLQFLLRVGFGGAKLGGGAAEHGALGLLLRYERPCTV